MSDADETKKPDWREQWAGKGRNAYAGIDESDLDFSRPEAQQKHAAEAPKAALPSVKRLVLDRNAPMESAREFIERECTREGVQLLRYWRGGFYYWTGSYYTPIDSERLEAQVWKFLNSAQILGKETSEGKKPYLPFNPKKDHVSNVLAAIQAQSSISSVADAPFWLSGAPAWSAQIAPLDIVPLKNGLYHLASERLTVHSPYLFNVAATDIAFDEQAPEPKAWLDFLSQVWPTDQESIDTLHEMLGYLISSATSQQKIFEVIGPLRSGKGTINKVIKALTGPAYTATTFSALGGPFGLQSLLDKGVCVIPDAALSGRADTAVITERLKSISGEDIMGVPRKHIGDWVGKLPTRFVIMSNKLLGFNDESGAFVSRLIVLRMVHSFLGKEDPTLFEHRLLPEIAGILNLALDGLRRLNARGRFKQPESASEAINVLGKLSSVIRAFVEDRCELNEKEQELTTSLYGVYKSWCLENGHRIQDSRWFFRDLLEAYPQLVRKRPLDEKTGKQMPVYVGIKVKSF